jgi:hypothetical protein
MPVTKILDIGTTLPSVKRRRGRVYQAALPDDPLRAAAAKRYLHTVDGRDTEIASALSALPAHGDAARLPKSIVVKH